MREKGNKYLEEFLTGSLGAALGGIAGLYFGPAGIIIGSGIGGSTGIIIVKNMSVPDVIKRLKLEFATKQLIKRKLKADFDDSFLADWQIVEAAKSDALRLLEAAKVIRENSKGKVLLSDNMIDVPKSELSSEVIQKHLELLNHYGPIKVSCSCISSAAVSVLKSLQERFGMLDMLPEEYGGKALALTVDSDALNGRYQAREVSKHCDFDFLVLANDAYFMAADRRIKTYKLMFPCFKIPQYLFYRKADAYGRASRIKVFQDSSAELQEKIRKGIPSLTDSEPIENAETIPFLIKNMSAGEMIIVWEPLAYLFRGNPDFAEMPFTRHKIYFSLFCHEKWAKPSMDAQRRAFADLFINEWRHCNTNRKRALRLVCDDEHFIERFAIGAGVKLMPQFQ